MIDGQLAEDLLTIDGFVNLRDQEGRLIRARVAEVNEAEVLLISTIRWQDKTCSSA